MNCVQCNKEISEARLKALPGTKKCVECSSIQRVAGFPIVTSKTTYSELQIVSQNVADELYEKQQRKGGLSEGVKFKNFSIPKLSNLE